MEFSVIFFYLIEPKNRGSAVSNGIGFHIQPTKTIIYPFSSHHLGVNFLIETRSINIYNWG